MYQIDLGCTRLLWIGKERTVKTFREFFAMIGAESAKIQFVCLDLPPILRQVVKAQIPTNGELSHGIGTQAVQQGVQAGRSPAA